MKSFTIVALLLIGTGCQTKGVNSAESPSVGKFSADEELSVQISTIDEERAAAIAESTSRLLDSGALYRRFTPPDDDSTYSLGGGIWDVRTYNGGYVDYEDLAAGRLQRPCRVVSGDREPATPKAAEARATLANQSAHAQLAEAQKLAAEYFEKYKAKSVSDD